MKNLALKDEVLRWRGNLLYAGYVPGCPIKTGRETGAASLPCQSSHPPDFSTTIKANSHLPSIHIGIYHWKRKGIMRIFKTKRFDRLAEKAGIADADLTAAAGEVNRGEYDADLGGGVFKKRIARTGAGKSGGYRVILFFRKDERLFFSYVFAKSSRANISEKELRDFKDFAKLYLEYTEKQLKDRIKSGRFTEVRL
jgi:hypothetical protein